MNCLSSLPVETLVRIARACDTARDKAALAATNRRIYGLANRVLYLHNIRHQDASAVAWAAQSSSRFKSLVTLVECGAELNDTAGSTAPANLYPSGFTHPQMEEIVNAVYTVLGVAAKAGNDLAVSWLVKRGARVDSPVHNLCSCQLHPGQLYGSNDLDEWGFSPTKSPFWTPLHIAICQGHASTAKILIEQGASLSVCKPESGGQTTALHTAAMCNNAEVIRYLVQNKLVDINAFDSRGFTPLVSAARAYAKDLSSPVPSPPHSTCSLTLEWQILATMNLRELSGLECLLKLGADRDLESGELGGVTAYTFAIAGGYYQAAKVLLNNGARTGLIPIQYLMKPSEDVFQWNFPRDWSVENWDYDRADLLRAFLGRGFNVNVHLNSERQTMAHITVLRQDALHLTRILLEAGVNLEVKNSRGRTPLHVAVERGPSIETVPLLLQYGARLDNEDDSGTRPIDIVVTNTRLTSDTQLFSTILLHMTSMNYPFNLNQWAFQTFYDRDFLITRVLLQHGANFSGYASVRDLSEAAIVSGDVDSLEVLLQFFAHELDLRSLVLGALRGSNYAICEVLLNRSDIPVNERSVKGDTCLHLACRSGQLQLVRRLVELGADVEARDTYGRTPVVLSPDYPEIERYLVDECGAKPFGILDSWCMDTEIEL